MVMGQGDTSDNNNRDASVNSADEENINIIDCQNVRSDQMVFVKITKVDIVNNSEVCDCLNFTANIESDFRENKT